MNLTRIVALIAVGLVFLGMLLPWSVFWMTGSDNQPTPITIWGLYTINAYLFGILILPFGIAAMIGAKKEPPGLKSSIVMAASALLICLPAAFFVVGFALEKRWSAHIGCHLQAFGAVVALVAAVMAVVGRMRVRQG